MSFPWIYVVFYLLLKELIKQNLDCPREKSTYHKPVISANKATVISTELNSPSLKLHMNDIIKTDLSSQFNHFVSNDLRLLLLGNHDLEAREITEASTGLLVGQLASPRCLIPCFFNVLFLQEIEQRAAGWQDVHTFKKEEDTTHCSQSKL